MVHQRRQPPRHPRGLFFDLDGVLVDSMCYHAQAWQMAVRRCLRVNVSRAEIYRREGEPGRVTARDLLCRHGQLPTTRAVQELLQDKERRFLALRRRVRLFPAALELLTIAGRNGLPLGLVTGTSQSEVERVVPPSVMRHFVVVVTGDQVPRGKPDPAPYRMACRRLRQRPASVVVVENAPFGIASARAAGAGWVIAVATSLAAAQLRDADVVLPSLRALCRYLRALLGHVAN